MFSAEITSFKIQTRMYTFLQYIILPYASNKIPLGSWSFQEKKIFSVFLLVGSEEG